MISHLFCSTTQAAAQEENDPVEKQISQFYSTRYKSTEELANTLPNKDEFLADHIKVHLPEQAETLAVLQFLRVKELVRKNPLITPEKIAQLKAEQSDEWVYAAPETANGNINLSRAANALDELNPDSLPEQVKPYAEKALARRKEYLSALRNFIDKANAERASKSAPHPEKE